MTVCPKCGHEPEPQPITNESIERAAEFIRDLEKFCAPMGINLEVGVRMMLLAYRMAGETEESLVRATDIRTEKP